MAAPGGAPRPHIVFILADDLGYGDIGAFNPDSRIPTPGIDRVANEGARLTDVHAASVCTPSRYQFVRGRYLFRAGKELMAEAVLDPGAPTVATVLRDAGYATAMVGKWHLGFEGLGIHPDPAPGTETLRGGPVDHGFDSYFGIPASLDVSPYFLIEDDSIQAFPAESIEESHSPGVRWPQGRFWREGGLAPGFRHEDVLPALAERAVSIIEGHADADRPLFLYLALPAPHAPWVPTEEFRGRSGAGAYGDFVMQVDDVVARVDDALTRAGLRDDTLLIFTSDNGPTWYEQDVARYGHRSSGDWRGMKADAWEGGNRMPFAARWPARIAPWTESAALVSFTDLVATFAALAGAEVPSDAALDGIDATEPLLGEGPGSRSSVVLEGDTDLAIRSGPWKLIPWLRDRSMFDLVFPPDGSVAEMVASDTAGDDGVLGQLYHLDDDPAERHNVYADHPEVVAELTALLADAIRGPVPAS